MEKIGDVLQDLGLKGSQKVSGNLSPKYDCTLCNDAGFVHPILLTGKPDYSQVVPCKCKKEELQKQKAEHMLERCGLPAGSEGLTFGSFTTDYNASLNDAYMASLDIADGSAGKLKWLTLLSGPDRGKTHLAVAICRGWLGMGSPARYAYVPLLLDELRKGFNSTEAEEQYEKVFEFYCNVPLLVLDDLGVEKHSDWAQEKLDTIIDYRYIRGLHLVVTTNLPMDMLPVRIASRLQRATFGKVVVIDTPEYRLRSK